MTTALRAIGALTLALPAILLSGCAATADSDCEEWGARVEPVKVCNSRGMNCSFQQQTVEYCARTSRQRAALSGAPGKAPAAARLQPKEAQLTQAPEKTVKPAPAPAAPERAAPAQKKAGKADAARDKTGMPDLTLFWQSLFSAARYPGLRYGQVKRATMGPAATPANSPRIEAELKARVRSVVSMEVASDIRFTPMDHRLNVVVYRAHNREAAVALYSVMMRDEWREKKSQTQPGVTLDVVKTDDKKGGGGQRTYLQRGAYVVEVDEWKSIYRNAAGKAVPGKQFPHTDPVSPSVVAKAVVGTFPAE